jgi:hypothetical protein
MKAEESAEMLPREKALDETGWSAERWSTSVAYESPCHEEFGARCNPLLKKQQRIATAAVIRCGLFRSAQHLTRLVTALSTAVQSFFTYRSDRTLTEETRGPTSLQKGRYLSRTMKDADYLQRLRSRIIDDQIARIRLNSPETKWP